MRSDGMRRWTAGYAPGMPTNQAGTTLTCANPDCGCELVIQKPCPHGDRYTCACGELLEVAEEAAN